MAAAVNEPGDPAPETPASPRTCPSGRCEQGAVLLGIVGPRGVVGYVAPQVGIGAEFVHDARLRGTPERRFRFAQPCVEQGCAQWTGSRCGVIDRVLGAAGGPRDSARTRQLPACTIRPTCRWFAQHGADACAVCPYVVTDARPPAADGGDAGRT